MYKEIKGFNQQVQKTLPLIYDDSLSYYEVIDKLVDYIEGLATETDISEVISAIDKEKVERELADKILKQNIDSISYDSLENKPKIEGVTLEGDKAYEELNLQRISNTELEEMFG